MSRTRLRVPGRGIRASTGKTGSTPADAVMRADRTPSHRRLAPPQSGCAHPGCPSSHLTSDASGRGASPWGRGQVTLGEAEHRVDVNLERATVGLEKLAESPLITRPSGRRDGALIGVLGVTLHRSATTSNGRRGASSSDGHLSLAPALVASAPPPAR